jgi:hypothetical protein
MARTPRAGRAAQDATLAEQAKDIAEGGDVGGGLAAAGRRGGIGANDGKGGGGGGGKNGNGGSNDGGEGPSLVSMAQAFSGLPMEALIGGPLHAAAEANQQMGLAQINFLMNTCFIKSADGKSYTPVMVTTSVTRNVLDISQSPPVSDPITATINLPLFTLLPINTLGVTSVQVDFTMNVTSSYSNEKNASASITGKSTGTYEETVDLFLSKTTISGSVSIDTQYLNSDKATYQKQNSATYRVSVSAAQLALPPGVTTLIQAFTNNITPITVKGGAK